MKKLKLFSVIFFLVILSSTIVFSWGRHDQMTREALKDMDWLDNFSSIAVTEYDYHDPTIQQTTIRYYNDDLPELGQDDFYYHALYEPVLFFKGAELGSTISAKDILADFSNEPDWDMDQNLDLSWMQPFHGESQGYRHMYYPAHTFHIPLGFYAQGQLPERVEHFYSLAKQAFANNDTYWGFRFLARTMHYLQDMSQPYHTRQFYWKFIRPMSPYSGTVQTIKNYHFAYESYQANRFRLEQEGVLPQDMMSAIHYSLPVQKDDPVRLAKYIAKRSYLDSSETMQYSIEFLGEKYLSSSMVNMTSEDFFQKIRQDDEISENFNEDTNRRMTLFGKATKSFLEFARRDLNLDQYQQ